MTTRSNIYPTAALQARDAAHHLHPFTTPSELAAKGARIITSAEGVWLTDSDGERILDAMAGLWCVNIGYGRAELAEAAHRQMLELPYYNTFFQTSHPPVIELAERLARLAPEGLDHVMFAGSGSEANDTNLRLVRHYWATRGEPERQIVLSRRNAYHGSTMAGASLGGMAAMHSQGGLPIPDIHHIGQPDWWSEGGDLSPEAFGLLRARELEETIERLGPSRIAAFIGEPVQGAGGVIIAPDSYWPEVMRICRAYGILFIADEVITGFGRTGSWWGSETLGLAPDIMTIAKGLSSGYAPIGGSIVSAKISETIRDAEFYHGYTYAGHPVASAVASENLRLMEEERVVEGVAEDTGPYLQARWQALAEHPMVGEAKIIGMMGSLALTPDKAARAPFASATGTVGFITREISFSHNLIMRHVGDRMIISPPLTITRAEIDILIERAHMVLDEAMVRVKAEGLWQAGRRD